MPKDLRLPGHTRGGATGLPALWEVPGPPKSPATLSGSGRWVGRRGGAESQLSQHQSHPHKPRAGSAHTQAPASQRELWKCCRG